VLISTVVTDIACIILLAVSVQLHRQSTNVSHMVVKGMSIFDHVSADFFGNSFVPVFLGIVIVYLVVSIVLVTFIGKWLNKIFQPGEDVLITFVILVILATVIVGELLGINLVVGAFIAGLGLSQVVQQRDMLLFRRMESIGYGFLIPFLFVSIGMEMDFTAFGASNSWMIVVLTVLGLIVSKVGSGYIALRTCGFNSPQGLAAGLMTVPQLSATLAAAAIGKESGILSPEFFNAIVILSIVTTLPVPSLVRSMVSSWSRTGIPSAVKDTSHST
jgi:Kef-type K+ transport system membrane component KefB